MLIKVGIVIYLALGAAIAHEIVTAWAHGFAPQYGYAGVYDGGGPRRNMAWQD